MALQRVQRLSSSTKPKVAVFYQALEPPVLDGITKPKKPGGYQDSGADIAFVLRTSKHAEVITPVDVPDTEPGILAAVKAGATHLWMNIILFAAHPLQASNKLSSKSEDLFILGQPPNLVANYDDKARVNEFLRSTCQFVLPKEIEAAVQILNLPIVAKPIRGRGSHGVKLCHTPEELTGHADDLFKEGSSIMLEQYLAGQEATITTIPPSGDELTYKSLPPVIRFKHQDGVAPYNGTVAVTQNSHVCTIQEILKDPAWRTIMSECDQVAELLGCTAPIRIDVRRASQGEDGKSEGRFAIFDVNLKPNMTGPGRPGRDDQASSSAMAAQATGWDYPQLLKTILDTAKSLREIRGSKSVLRARIMKEKP
ncbi:glutathione synthetase ATP-binding domain-like protein [Melanomma pulvis-pyrius CBS 109.77]|uniref:Glutathione synthetase ATP-binding domain-like protein n=1 Tax=Melanomma pulvis-pyrius CBS 109.77 TaxID=1314802 RepID=A0A6A6XLJ3_9PLEO|nr:glutathione synthetase ATP-binding domain-like protein [Melanomma pulvis-pyrius CBS 109.77]